MGRSRLEINFRRLLSRCELMAKDNSSDDWRLEKVSKFCTMLVHFVKAVSLTYVLTEMQLYN